MFLIPLVLGDGGVALATGTAPPTTRRPIPQDLLHGPVGPYFSAVNAYQEGRVEQAAQTALSWSPDELARFTKALKQLVHRIIPCPRLPDDIPISTVEAAVLVHVDAALQAGMAEARAEFDRHLGTGRELFAWNNKAVVAFARINTCGFEPLSSRDFHLAVSQVLLGRRFDAANASSLANDGASRVAK